MKPTFLLKKWFDKFFWREYVNFSFYQFMYEVENIRNFHAGLDGLQKT